MVNFSQPISGQFFKKKTVMGPATIVYILDNVWFEVLIAYTLDNVWFEVLIVYILDNVWFEVLIDSFWTMYGLKY